MKFTETMLCRRARGGVKVHLVQLRIAKLRQDASDNIIFIKILFAWTTSILLLDASGNNNFIKTLLAWAKSSFNCYRKPN